VGFHIVCTELDDGKIHVQNNLDRIWAEWNLNVVSLLRSNHKEEALTLHHTVGKCASRLRIVPIVRTSDCCVPDRHPILPRRSQGADASKERREKKQSSHGSPSYMAKNPSSKQ